MLDNLKPSTRREEHERRERRRDDAIAEGAERAPDGQTTVVYSRVGDVSGVRDRLAVEWEQRPLVVLLSVALALAALAILLWFEIPSRAIDAVPPLGWAALWYAGVGSLIAGAVAYAVVRRISDPVGVEVMDLDPITARHRHLRVGDEIWDDLVVKTPWGESVGMDELQEITVNGRHGYELMDLRVPRDGPPTCVATWMGETDAATLRTYKHAVVYARQRLSKRANRAMALDANREAIVREAAERVVVDVIRTHEEAGMPSGDKITATVEDVLSDFGVDDGLNADLSDDRIPDDALDDDDLDRGRDERASLGPQTEGSR